MNMQHSVRHASSFLVLAAGRGIKVHIPAEADLLKTRFLYGYQEAEEQAWLKKCDNMTKTMGEKEAKLRQEIEIKQAQLHQYTGAKMAVKELNKIWQ